MIVSGDGKSLDGARAPYKAGVSFPLSFSEKIETKKKRRFSFETKNKNEKGSAFEELSTARSFEVISEYDSIARTRKGVDAGTFIGFDLVTKNISRRPLSFDDHYGNMKHGNKTPNFSAINFIPL